MTTADIKRLGLVLAIQVEIEGMKAENKQRERQDYSMAYNDLVFYNQAEKIMEIVNKHDDQL